MAQRMTPRLVKRFQNRMRYLAERMRVQRPDVDWGASLLHLVGRVTGKQLVPSTWFSDQDQNLIPEDALILLGTLEIFAPDSFRSDPDSFWSTVEGKIEKEARYLTIWKNIKTEFDCGHDPQLTLLSWPTSENIAAYQEFVKPLLR
jgi:hypothetical protein